MIPYHRPGDPGSATLVAERIARYAAQGTPLRAVMLARLGPERLARSPAQAMAVLEELEETARLWLLCAAEAAAPVGARVEGTRTDFRLPLVAGSW